MSLEPGTSIAPNVYLVRPLGEGGMGSVWVAQHTRLGTEVAVKLITHELAADPAVRSRFVREAQAAARIRDPHIVQVFDQGVMEDGQPFLVMELLDGETLAHHVDGVGRLSLGEAATLVTQVAGALHKAHRMGIVHRDIKPDNLFLTSAGGAPFVKILDFGIAKQHGTPAHGTTTGHGAILGTPVYMSPEQLLDAKNADGSVDVWALAVVAYEMVTGQLPFAGDTFAALNLAICTARYTPASIAAPSLGGGLDAFFARAFDIDRAQRFATAVELANAFREACGASAATVPLLAPEPERSSLPSQPKLDGARPASVMGAATTVSLEAGSGRRWRVPLTSALAGAALAAGAFWWASFDRGTPLPTSDPPTSAAEPTVADVAPSVAVTVSEPTSQATPSASAIAPRPAIRRPVRSSAAPSASARSKADCTDPFFIDKNGIKRVRRECL